MLGLVAGGSQAATTVDGYAAVDPFIGTAGSGHTFPGATLPFGMVQVSPDTDTPNFKHAYAWAAGYQYGDPTIKGFSQTHFSGAGHSDLGDVLLMPMAGPVRTEPGQADQPGSGYRSRFSHRSEQAHPGYYAVTLDDNHVRVELTATRRVAVQRYTFAAGQAGHVVLDLRSSIYDYPGKTLWSWIHIRPDGVITGFRETRGWAPGRQLYFALRFSHPVTGHQLLDTEPTPLYGGFAPPAAHDPSARPAIQGRDLEAVFDFGDLQGKPLVAEVAISDVDEAGAIANLQAETPDFDFDKVHQQARQIWQQQLQPFQIQAPAAMQRSLYTALYHAFIAPNLAMDVDGRYRGPDNQVHQARGFNFYSTFSLWDTYRAEHPLLTLLQPPQLTADIIHSMIASQQSSPYGILPVWSYAGLENWCMIGYHALPVIADAYMKGIRGFPLDQALQAMQASAEDPAYGDLKDYMKMGYVPIDHEPEAASKTVEYAYDDWTLAQMATAMGRSELAKQFIARAGNWRNVFDPASGFFRAKLSDGRFRTPFDPAAAGYGSDYTEGNAWQYSWYVPQDIAALIADQGGNTRFVQKLDQLFDAKVPPGAFANVEDISGLIGFYAHGNEPSHHVAYLYDYAGQPWRTQERLSQIVDSQYGIKPDGLVGNDDLGQMSAWLLFTAFGFYPVTPASNQYVIGRPFVERADLHLPNGKTFTISASPMDAAHPYVGQVTLNGRPLERLWLSHQELEAGGELHFRMQAHPNRQWATAPAARPYAMSADKYQP
ncbi:GH92 family glycosyl hydrolase [Frateuria aurantia]